MSRKRILVVLVVLAGAMWFFFWVLAGADRSETLPAASVAKEDYNTIHMRVTAYCPCVACCGRWSDGIAANGHRMRKGDKLVAAPEKYAFGTRMIIKGYNNGNPVLVKDRGGAIKNDNLDVFFSFHEEAKQWGVQYIDVKVMEAARNGS